MVRDVGKADVLELHPASCNRQRQAGLLTGLVFQQPEGAGNGGNVLLGVHPQAAQFVDR